MPRIKFHLENYQSKNDVFKQIQNTVTELLNSNKDKIYLYYDIDNKRFIISFDRKNEFEELYELDLDMLIKLQQGEYRNILEKEGYEKYQQKIISKQLKVSKDLTPTYLKHRLPEIFTIKNTKEIIKKLKNNSTLYVGYKILDDEFVFTTTKLSYKDYVYLFKISKSELIKIISIYIFSYISINKW